MPAEGADIRPIFMNKPHNPYCYPGTDCKLSPDSYEWFQNHFCKKSKKPINHKIYVHKQGTLSREIRSWWLQFRPVGWTTKQHMENPTVNTVSDSDRRLAKIAAKLMKAQMKRNVKKLLKRVDSSLK
jgi:hypothetical protein